MYDSGTFWMKPTGKGFRGGLSTLFWFRGNGTSRSLGSRHEYNSSIPRTVLVHRERRGCSKVLVLELLEGDAIEHGCGAFEHALALCDREVLSLDLREDLRVSRRAQGERKLARRRPRRDHNLSRVQLQQRAECAAVRLLVGDLREYHPIVAEVDGRDADCECEHEPRVRALSVTETRPWLRCACACMCPSAAEEGSARVSRLRLSLSALVRAQATVAAQRVLSAVVRAL